jgi:hypothetical protein
MYENNSKIHLDRSLKDTEIAKELNMNPVFAQNTGLQEKIDTTRKSNAT